MSRAIAIALSVLAFAACKREVDLSGGGPVPSATAAVVPTATGTVPEVASDAPAALAPAVGLEPAKKPSAPPVGAHPSAKPTGSNAAPVVTAPLPVPTDPIPPLPPPTVTVPSLSLPPACIAAQQACSNPGLLMNPRVRAACERQKIECANAGGKI